MIGQRKTGIRGVRKSVFVGLVLATLLTGTAATTATAGTNGSAATNVGTHVAADGVRIGSVPAVAQATGGAIAGAASRGLGAGVATTGLSAAAAMTWVTVRSTGNGVRLRTFPTTGKVLTLIWQNERYLAWCYVRTPDGYNWAYSWAHGVKGWVRMDFMVSVDAERGVYVVPC